MQGEGIRFDYYYGSEAEQFTFFRIPKLLITDRRFSGISAEAKLLYGMMLDRMSLSLKNGWLDDENRVYIIYPVEEIMEELGVSNKTAIKFMTELGTKGIGLIEKIRRGLGKPDIIYVKNFVTERNTAENDGKKSEPSNTKNEDEPTKKTLGKPDFPQKCKNYTSGNVKNTHPEVKILHANNTDINNTDMSDILSDPIVSDKKPADTIRTDTIDIHAYEAQIKKNIEYEHLIVMYRLDASLLDSIVALMTEILLSTEDTILIAKSRFPAQYVKERMLKLNQMHIQYVFECFQKNTTKVANIKQYLLAALFNSYTTIDGYYTSEVHHDYPQFAPK